MGIQTSWGNPEHTLILHTFEGDWTWQEFFETWDTTQQMVEGCEHQVVTIVDMRRTDGIPDYGFEPLRRVIGHRPDRHSALTIIVQAGQPLQRFWRMFAQFYPGAPERFNIRFVTTLEEAHGLVEQVAVGLWLQEDPARNEGR